MIQGESLCGEWGGRGIADQKPIDPVQARASIPQAWRVWTVVLAVLIAWQLGWAIDLIPPIGLPSPLEIVIALWQLISSGELWDHLEATSLRLGLGWSLGAAMAVLASMMSRRWAVARSPVVAVSATAAAVPAIALLPLFVIWLGTGEAPMIATTALAAFAAGLSAARAPADDGRTRPVIETVETLRSSLPTALAVLIAVEMIAGGFGLGALIFSAAELYRSDQIVAGCLVLALIGLAVPRLLDFLARKLAPRTVQQPGIGLEER